MKKIKDFLYLAYQRLFSGDTPLFFKIWGAFITALIVVATVLSQQILSAPVRIQEKYEIHLWIFNTLVLILAGLSPYMTTRNNRIGQDNFKQAIQAAKESKVKLKDYKTNNNG